MAYKKTKDTTTMKPTYKRPTGSTGFEQSRPTMPMKKQSPDSIKSGQTHTAMPMSKANPESAEVKTKVSKRDYGK